MPVNLRQECARLHGAPYNPYAPPSGAEIDAMARRRAREARGSQIVAAPAFPEVKAPFASHDARPPIDALVRSQPAAGACSRNAVGHPAGTVTIDKSGHGRSVCESAPPRPIADNGKPSTPRAFKGRVLDCCGWLWRFVFWCLFGGART